MLTEGSLRVAIVDCPSSPGATAAVRKALEDLRLDPVVIPDGGIRSLSRTDCPTLVINPAGQRTMHERVRVVADLELSGYDHAGSGLAPCVLALSPAATFQALAAAGVPLPEFAVVRAAGPGACVTDPAVAHPRPPVLIRCTEVAGVPKLVGPILAEDGAAVSRALSAVEAGPARPALIQTRPVGRRFGVAVIGGDEPVAFVERDGMADGWEAPGSPSPADVALSAFAALGYRDYGEFRLVATDDGRILVEAADPLPRLEPQRSAFVRAATASGLSFSECVGSIVEATLARLDRRPATTARPILKTIEPGPSGGHGLAWVPLNPSPR